MLPLEIIREIAAVDIPTYYALVRALPPFARWCADNPEWPLKTFGTPNRFGFITVNGKLHSFNDKPAAVYEDGTQYWYKNDKRHRDGDKPAVITSDMQAWFKDGLRHRDDGPAEIWEGGAQWWVNDKLLQ